MKGDQKFKAMNQSVAFTFLETQDFLWGYFSTQMIIQNFGPTEDSDNIVMHYDSWGVNTHMLLFYKSGGGKNDMGGPVIGTDTIIFEYQTGDAGIRVETTCQALL